MAASSMSIRAFIGILFSCLSYTGFSNAQTLSNSSNGHFTSLDVYPSPNITGAGGWTDALGRARDFVNQLSWNEKVYMVTGVRGPCVGNILPIPRLGFNGLCLQDGPLAIRQATYASVFSAGLSVAASWDQDLTYQRAVALGQEFKGKGAHVALGPVVGPLGRHALAGRNWEGFSPDPYLTGTLVNTTVTGMQAAGVQTCTKHYIGNEQETQRNPSTVSRAQVEAVSSNIDDRTMHELYLWPFADALKAGTTSIMCSYNRVNQTYGCQNSKTLNGLLKGELGFQVSLYLLNLRGILTNYLGICDERLGRNSFGGSWYFRRPRYEYVCLPIPVSRYS